MKKNSNFFYNETSKITRDLIELMNITLKKYVVGKITRNAMRINYPYRAII